MEKFAIGLVVGALGGAVLAANNYKMRTLIKKGQEEMKIKLDMLMDEKIDDMETTVETMKEQAAEAVDNLREKAEDVKEKARKGMKKKSGATA
jgi:negative regulator of genetic competence, sporulation and motility